MADDSTLFTSSGCGDCQVTRVFFVVRHTAVVRPLLPRALLDEVVLVVVVVGRRRRTVACQVTAWGVMLVRTTVREAPVAIPRLLARCFEVISCRAGLGLSPGARIVSFAPGGPIQRWTPMVSCRVALLVTAAVPVSLFIVTALLPGLLLRAVAFVLRLSTCMVK